MATRSSDWSGTRAPEKSVTEKKTEAPKTAVEQIRDSAKAAIGGVATQMQGLLKAPRDIEISFEGIKPPDSTWTKLKNAWDSLELANLSKPPDLIKYFGGKKPDPAGVAIEIKAKRSDVSPGVVVHEVDLRTLPEHTAIVRVTVKLLDADE